MIGGDAYGNTGCGTISGRGPEDNTRCLITWQGEEYVVTQAQYSAFHKLQYDLAKAIWIKDYKEHSQMKQKPMEAKPAISEEYTGGSSSYYIAQILHPTSPGVDPYQAECNDIIEALQMNYAEGSVFKATWRKAAARQGKLKKGYDNGLYDSEKVEFFGKRLVVQSKTTSSVSKVANFVAALVCPHNRALGTTCIDCPKEIAQ